MTQKNKKNKKELSEELCLNLVKEIVSDVAPGYVYEGIYHDSGKGVVTDGKRLFASSALYCKKLEGLTISTRNFKAIDGLFPDYKKVIPNLEGFEMLTDFLIPEKSIKKQSNNYAYINSNGTMSKTKSKHSLVKIDYRFLHCLLPFKKADVKFNLHIQRKDIFKPIYVEFIGYATFYLLMRVSE